MQQSLLRLANIMLGLGLRRSCRTMWCSSCQLFRCQYLRSCLLYSLSPSFQDMLLLNHRFTLYFLGRLPALVARDSTVHNHFEAGLTSCCVQVWASSAYGALPSSASLYASTTSMLGPKSPLRRLDWGHWSLISGLAVVSAMYLWRETVINRREHRLRRELSNSQAEIAKLIMKVINKLQYAPIPSRINDCNGDIAGCQHAALHAISRTSANHPPHLQHVYCDAFPVHTSCVRPPSVQLV